MDPRPLPRLTLTNGATLTFRPETVCQAPDIAGRSPRPVYGAVALVSQYPAAE
jgi:hypothetical protein